MITSNTLSFICYFVSLRMLRPTGFFLIDGILFVIDVCSAYGTALSILQSLSKNFVEELSKYVCHCGEDSSCCRPCGEWGETELTV